MKRIYSTAAILLLFCGAVFAQESQPQIASGEEKVKDYTWKTQRPRHEFQFGIGDHTMYRSGFFDEYYYNYEHERNVKWFGSDTYIKTKIYTPVFSLTYHYRLLKWLSFGGYISYANASTKKINILTEEKTTFHEHFVAIAPSVRFTYLNRKYVTLYSGLGISMTWNFNQDEDGMKTWSYVSGQLTLVGVSVGKKWYGFAELGYGDKGIITAGFGYRFGSK